MSGLAFSSVRLLRNVSDWQETSLVQLSSVSLWIFLGPCRPAWTGGFIVHQKTISNWQSLIVILQDNRSRKLGLYRIFSNPVGARFCRIWNDIRLETDSQINCSCTNLTCKTLQTYEWFEFLIIFSTAVTVTSLTCTHTVIYATTM